MWRFRFGNLNPKPKSLNAIRVEVCWDGELGVSDHGLGFAVQGSGFQVQGLACSKDFDRTPADLG